ncbi:MAG: energy transducer TonB [Crocinitomicaceae bacterium]
MKKVMQSISFLLVGAFVLSACTEEKMGESPKKIAENIDVDLEEIVQDTISLDTVVMEEPIVPPPPPPPEPIPPSPLPDPEPLPKPPPLLPLPVNPIVDFPEVQPEYPGGEEAMFKFVTENIKYPQIDLEMGNEGRVYLEFIVEKDGTLANFKVLRGVSKSMDSEATRVAKLMPKWKPGEAGGKIVRTKMRLPFTFRLN